MDAASACMAGMQDNGNPINGQPVDNFLAADRGGTPEDVPCVPPTQNFNPVTHGNYVVISGSS